MRVLLCLILILIFCGFFITFNCKNASEPELNRPEIPRVVPKSADDSDQEKGIDAIPEGEGIFFEWFLPQDRRIKWIKIYRRAQNEEDFLFLTSMSSVDTFYIDYDLFPEVTYYYYLKAVTATKIESLPSDTIRFKLYPKPEGLSCTGQSKPVFSWYYPAIPPIGYLLRLENKETKEIVWHSFIGQVFESIVSVNYNWDGTAAVDSLSKNQKFRWRVDVVGEDQFSGSESNWKLLEIK